MVALELAGICALIHFNKWKSIEKVWMIVCVLMLRERRFLIRHVQIGFERQPKVTKIYEGKLSAPFRSQKCNIVVEVQPFQKTVFISGKYTYE